MKLRHLCFALVLSSSIAVSCCRGQGVGAGGGGGGAAAPAGTQKDDAIQIVAHIALCFDNRQLINRCLQSVRMHMNSTGDGATDMAEAPTPGPSAAWTPAFAPAPGPSEAWAPAVARAPRPSEVWAPAFASAPGPSEAWAPAFAPAPGPSAAGSATNNGSIASIMCQGPCFEEMMLMMTCVNDILVDNIQGYSPGLMQGIEAIFQMFCGNVDNGHGDSGAGGGTSNSAVAAGSHVAVNNLGEQTGSAAGPTASLKSGFPSMLITWNCIWLLPMLYVAL